MSPSNEPRRLLLSTREQTGDSSTIRPRRLHLTMVSDPCELVLVERLLETVLATSLPRDSARGDQIVLAVSEAVCNVMRHGYGNRCDQLIELTCAVTAEGLQVIIEDEAPPPPPAFVQRLCERCTELPAAQVTDIESIPESGWGLGLIARATQRVRYERRETRNRLELDFPALSAD